MIFVERMGEKMDGDFCADFRDVRKNTQDHTFL